MDGRPRAVTTGLIRTLLDFCSPTAALVCYPDGLLEVRSVTGPGEGYVIVVSRENLLDVLCQHVSDQVNDWLREQAAA